MERDGENLFAVKETKRAHRPLTYAQMYADVAAESSNIGDLMQIRARECAACLGVADALNAGVDAHYSLVDNDYDWSRFKARIDLTQPMLVGHSMGSLTAMAAPAVTDRFAVAFCLDGLIWPLFANGDQAVFNTVAKAKTPLLIAITEGNFSHLHNPKNRPRQRRLLNEVSGSMEFVLK